MIRLYLSALLLFIFNYHVSGNYLYYSNYTMEDVKKLKVILPVDEYCPFDSRYIDYNGENVKLCRYNIFYHKNEKCLLFDSYEKMDDLPFMKDTVLILHLNEYGIKCSLLREEKCNSDDECGEEEKCYNNI
ncbi:hypothetical protein BCR36DRAFT_374532 [Piromyces finnis]|uniref:Apple domain-containing protein n=1 Tax=Piromyces finnis TaxID=1754191 RepID=A0A1Y1UWE0_9FUNG|nr:hypothetical protein BCR36DRAFT_374532 [Piromyces finnis]|eukprot:ORX42381.1 hypothetical protein BCR36DRAFT_374532 [Piromyces finnis]